MKSVWLISLALTAAACGSSSPPATNGQPTGQASGRLVVSEQGKEPCCYVEGYIRFLRIRSDSGTAFEGRWESDGRFERSLPPGSYVVTRYLRPCDGNCSLLDPPSERCSVRITITGASATQVRSLPMTLGTCRLALGGG
jgi:hypothetical protein